MQGPTLNLQLLQPDGRVSDLSIPYVHSGFQPLYLPVSHVHLGNVLLILLIHTLNASCGCLLLYRRRTATVPQASTRRTRGCTCAGAAPATRARATPLRCAAVCGFRHQHHTSDSECMCCHLLNVLTARPETDDPNADSALL